MDKIQIGQEIKQRRLYLKLTQKELASNICSQPLLSHIEAGDYMPAANIFIALYQKLGLTDNLMTLQNYFPISPTAALNQKCESLCRQHDYADLKNFLLADETLDVVADDNLQAYYYYLGVVLFQLGEASAAKQQFNLALAEPHKLTPISRLILACLGTLSALEHQAMSSKAYFDKAFAQLDDSTIADYDENINAIFYLKAYSLTHLGEDKQALKTLEAGIGFTAAHYSHYMLSNFYYLAAVLVDEDKQQQYRYNSQLFESLYHEKIFDQI